MFDLSVLVYVLIFLVLAGAVAYLAMPVYFMRVYSMLEFYVALNFLAFYWVVLHPPNWGWVTAEMFFKKMTRGYLRIKLSNVPGTKEIYQGDCVFLLNHTGWADFAIDGDVLGARVTYLARKLVAVVLPFLCFSAWFNGIIAFFDRGSKSRSPLVHSIYEGLARHHPGNRRLICYPEGHRNSARTSLPLKPGGLVLLWKYNLGNVQVVNVGRKADVCSEKTWRVKKGVHCTVNAGVILRTQDYDDETAWLAAVQAEWDRVWTSSLEWNDKQVDGEPYVHPPFTYQRLGTLWPKKIMAPLPTPRLTTKEKAAAAAGESRTPYGQ